MRKQKPRDRSFQPSGAGKGCADRTSDDVAYRENFDAINWNRPVKVFLSDYAGDWDFIRTK